MPKGLYQSFLDTVSRAVMDGDLVTVLRHVALPLMMSTRNRQIVASCPEEMDIVMSDLRSHLRAHDVTVYRRTCIEAGYFPGMSDMIIGRHLTEALSHDGPAMPSHTSHMALLLIGGQWKALWLESDADDRVIPMLSSDLSHAQAAAALTNQVAGHDSRPPMKGPEK
ncbi:hypothetical protein HKCCSP123_14215 [Rhodobacterales bacterium HKCCSP123]|nr:hypothetical protein [Rhodobacterales bacterium HKCCSP123]